MDGMGMISMLSYSGVLCQVIEDSSQGEAEACLGDIEQWQWVRKYRLGGGFKCFFIFTPTWGNDPIE